MFKVKLYKYIPVLIVPWLPWGTGFALPILIVSLTRSKRDLTDAEYIGHLEHEFTHVKQWWKYLLIGFILLYMYLYWKHGYKSMYMFLEDEARTAEQYMINNRQSVKALKRKWGF